MSEETNEIEYLVTLVQTRMLHPTHNVLDVLVGCCQDLSSNTQRYKVVRPVRNPDPGKSDTADRRVTVLLNNEPVAAFIMIGFAANDRKIEVWSTNDQIFVTSNFMAHILERFGGEMVWQPPDYEESPLLALNVAAGHMHTLQEGLLEKGSEDGGKPLVKSRGLFDEPRGEPPRSSPSVVYDQADDNSDVVSSELNDNQFGDETDDVHFDTSAVEPDEADDDDVVSEVPVDFPPSEEVVCDIAAAFGLSDDADDASEDAVVAERLVPDGFIEPGDEPDQAIDINGGPTESRTSWTMPEKGVEG